MRPLLGASCGVMSAAAVHDFATKGPWPYGPVDAVRVGARATPTLKELFDSNPQESYFWAVFMLLSQFRSLRQKMLAACCNAVSGADSFLIPTQSLTACHARPFACQGLVCC